MTESTSTDELLKELLATVNSLKKEVDELKAKDDGRTYPQKCQCDGDDGEEGNESHDGDKFENHNGDFSDAGEEESDGSHASQFTLSTEGEAFLEATFNSRLSYKDQIVRYGEPDSKWTTCPSISPVVAATLPSAALKDDKVAFRAQEMYMEAMAPLAALLESTDDENFTIKEAIPMVQSAVRLLGDATQYHSSLRRKAIIQYLNPQLQALMKDIDFKESQPLLLGEDFGEKAKLRMEAAAALRKVVNPTVPKVKLGFQKSHPQKTTWGHQGGKTKQYGPTYKAKKNQGAKTSQGKS